MAIVEEHVSPDGPLRFVVYEDTHGDLSLGFDGFAWDIDARTLAMLTGVSVPEAVRQYVDHLLNDRSVIAVWSVLGEVQNVWISDNATRDAVDPGDGEIELRYWSGRPWDGA